METFDIPRLPEPMHFDGCEVAVGSVADRSVAITVDGKTDSFRVGDRIDIGGRTWLVFFIPPASARIGVRLYRQH